MNNKQQKYKKHSANIIKYLYFYRTHYNEKEYSFGKILIKMYLINNVVKQTWDHNSYST